MATIKKNRASDVFMSMAKGTADLTVMAAKGTADLSVSMAKGTADLTVMAAKGTADLSLTTLKGTADFTVAAATGDLSRMKDITVSAAAASRDLTVAAAKGTANITVSAAKGSYNITESTMMATVNATGKFQSTVTQRMTLSSSMLKEGDEDAEADEVTAAPKVVRAEKPKPKTAEEKRQEVLDDHKMFDTSTEEGRAALRREAFSVINANAKLREKLRVSEGTRAEVLQRLLQEYQYEGLTYEGNLLSTVQAGEEGKDRLELAGTQFTGFTGTKIQTLTQKQGMLQATCPTDCGASARQQRICRRAWKSCGGSRTLSKSPKSTSERARARSSI